MSTATARQHQPFEDPPERVGTGRATATPLRQRQAAQLRQSLRKPGSRKQAAKKPDPGVVEPPPDPVTAPRAPFVMLVLVLVSAGIIGLLVLNTKINENSFQLEGLRDRQAALDIQEQQLRSQLADNQSPGNLAAAARRLGLVPAGAPAFLRLPDGTVIRMPQPGGPGTTGNGG